MLRLKEARLAIGATQEQVAAHLGVSRVAYTNIENGKRDPDTDTLIALAQRFGVSADYLLGIEKAAQHELDGQIEELLSKAQRLSPQGRDKLSSYLGYLLAQELQDKPAPSAAAQATND